MKIEPRAGILLVKKNKNKEIASDIYVTEADDDKRLVTCTVVRGADYHEGEILITGRYSLYQLSYLGEDYYFLDKDDIIGTLSQDV